MSELPGTGIGPRPARRRLLELNLTRAAAALLGGLFALLYLVLLPRGGGDSSVQPAAIVDPPPGPPNASVGIQSGNLARDFEASNLDGLRFRLSDLRGQPVVINFWATWCSSCAAEMPVLEEQRRAHLDDNLAIVGVNVGEGAGTARGFVERLELFAFAIGLDTDLTLADAYGVRGLPQSVFIDSNGVIRALYKGQLDDETMNRYVRASIDAVPGGDAPFQLRLVNTVPREHTLDVLPSQDDPGSVLFASRRLRCDDAYCGDAIVESLRGLSGVTAVDLRTDAVPPTLRVDFDSAAVELDQIVTALADAMSTHPDSLYTQELQVRYR